MYLPIYKCIKEIGNMQNGLGTIIAFKFQTHDPKLVANEVYKSIESRDP